LSGSRDQEFVPWYMQPRVVKGYEGWYEGKYKRADNLEKRVLSVMIERFDHPKKILEVGSGTSHFTRWLASQGFSATGADLSPYMVRQAKTLWPEGDLLNARSSNLPFESNSFDLAMFVTCFEYMPDPIGVLREASRIAKQGVVIGLMNAWSLPTLRRKLQMAFGKNDYYLHAHFYSISEMKGLVKKAFGDQASLVKWRTTLFPQPLRMERDTGNPFGAFLGVAIKKKA
jgi:ubiquinone/menaquinone biosynthesis C-methylase UbiE